MVLVAWTLHAEAQIKRYDTDFFVSQRDFLVAVPIEVERNQIYVTLDFNGRPLRFKLDTGASQGILYDDVQLPGVVTLGTIESEDAAGHIRQMPQDISVRCKPSNCRPSRWDLSPSAAIRCSA